MIYAGSACLTSLLTRTAVVVLAAGQSQRLGSPKQLVRVQGTTLIARTLSAIAGLAVPHTFVVLSDRCAELESELMPFQVTPLHNPAPGQGMSSSLRLGLSAARVADPGLLAVVFTLCDQPYIHTQLLRGLVRGLAKGHPIAASHYAGVLGVPAAFKRESFDELQTLQGDQGARTILRRQSSQVLAVPFEQGLIDIDCRDDLGACQ